MSLDVLIQLLRRQFQDLPVWCSSQWHSTYCQLPCNLCRCKSQSSLAKLLKPTDCSMHMALPLCGSSLLACDFSTVTETPRFPACLHDLNALKPCEPLELFHVSYIPCQCLEQWCCWPSQHFDELDAPLCLPSIQILLSKAVAWHAGNGSHLTTFFSAYLPHSSAPRSIASQSLHTLPLLDNMATTLIRPL